MDDMASGHSSFLQHPVTNVSVAQTQIHQRIKPEKAKFPEKLMEAMLKYGEEDSVRWLSNGQSFVILSPEKFVKNVLHKAFRKAQYPSFIRRLRRWGFIRLTSSSGTDCFRHPLFQRDRRDLVAKISCPGSSRREGKEEPEMPKSDRHEGPPSVAIHPAQGSSQRIVESSSK